MSKKDYEAIARLIRLWRSPGSDGGVLPARRFVEELCKMFAEDNPLFKADRFRYACGLLGCGGVPQASEECL